MSKVFSQTIGALLLVVVWFSVCWSASSKVGGSVVNNVRSRGLEVVHRNTSAGGSVVPNSGSVHATAAAIELSGSEVSGTVLNVVQAGTLTLSSTGKDNGAAVGAVILENSEVGAGLVNRIESSAIRSLQIGQGNRTLAAGVVLENSKVHGSIDNQLEAQSVSVVATGSDNRSIAGSIYLSGSEVQNSVENHVRVGSLTALTDGTGNQAHAAAIVMEAGSAHSISNMVEAETISAVATGDSSIANAASVNLFHATVNGEIVNQVTAGEIIAEARNGGRVDLGSVDIRNSVVDGAIYNLSQDSMQGSADGGIVTVNSVIEE